MPLKLDNFLAGKWGTVTHSGNTITSAHPVDEDSEWDELSISVVPPSPVAELPAREAAPLDVSVLGPSLARQTTAWEDSNLEDTTESQTAIFASGSQNISGGNFMSAGNIHFNQRITIPPRAATLNYPAPSIDPWGASTADSIYLGTPPAAFTDPWSRPGTPQIEKSTPYFDQPTLNNFKQPGAEQATPGFFDTVCDHADIAGLYGSVTTPFYVEQAPMPDREHYEEAEYYQDRFAQHAASSIHELQEVAASKWAELHHGPGHSYGVPSYPGQEVWGDIPVVDGRKEYCDAVPASSPAPGHKGNGLARAGHVTSHTSSVRPSCRSSRTTDLFADAAPKVTYISHSDALHMPQPGVGAQYPQPPEEEDCESVDGVVIMPTPSRDVIHLQNFGHSPSQSSHHPARSPFETDETFPLLLHPGSEGTYLPTIPGHAFVSEMEPLTTWQPDSVYIPNQPKLHDLGWLEYHLPDATTYYFHPTRRVTTDCNLRADRVLAEVSAYLEDDKGHRSGWEMWLRDIGTPRRGFVPARSWVDHHTRVVVPDQTACGTGTRKEAVEDDHLDVEYRYWSYVEAHPAHKPLPPESKAEALAVLNWAWTDRLLPSPAGVPALFTQEECQELMTLLGSFGDDETENEKGFQSRIVSRVLLRLAQWRQLYYRPSKPLSKDASTAGRPHLPTHQPTILLAFLHFIISYVCPRILRALLGHVRDRRLSEVGGLRDDARLRGQAAGSRAQKTPCW